MLTECRRPWEWDVLSLKRRSKMKPAPSSLPQASSSLSVRDTKPVVPKKEESNNATNEHALDFIGSSHAVKDLFALPYISDRPVSVAVHNIGGTLLLDTDSDAMLKLQRSQQDTSVERRASPVGHSLENPQLELLPSLEEESAQSDHSAEEIVTQSLVALSDLASSVSGSKSLTLVNTIIQSAHELQSRKEKSESDGKQDMVLVGIPSAEEYVHRHIPPSPEPRDYLSWKFNDMNLLVGSDALVYRTPDSSHALTLRVEDASHMRNLFKSHQDAIKSGRFLADHQFSHLQQRGKPSYSEAAKRSLPVADQPKPKKSEMQPQQQKNFVALDLGQVQLQTCIVPSQQSPIGAFVAASHDNDAITIAQRSDASSPVSTVVDAYLDNIMANVPQLALCLREKGFIQSVKLMETQDIPSAFMNPSTLDTSTVFGAVRGTSPADNVFSPEVMEMNASALLRFLKANCTKDNATYLLRRDAGHTNIQLYDISSISAQRQRKWIWWLAMMSYRFSHRLRQLSISTNVPSFRRDFRARQRSLLENALELLEMLRDMDGNAHESLIAAIRENLADTFLCQDVSSGEEGPTTEETFHPAPATSSQQPYSQVTLDALNKAQDHLSMGIKCLLPVLEKQLPKSKEFDALRSSPWKKSSTVIVESVLEEGGDTDTEESDDEVLEAKAKSLDRLSPVTTQLFGLHFKLVNVGLRLAEIHLKNYFSSSAMQALRNAARRLSYALQLLSILSCVEKDAVKEWTKRVQLQYVWLWEHCGHFARSFAGDEHWRDRGHASGEDVNSVLQDVEKSFSMNNSIGKTGRILVDDVANPDETLSKVTKGMVDLSTLSGVVDFDCNFDKKVQSIPKEEKEEGIAAALKLLDSQKLLPREQQKVLVASCIAYDRAHHALVDLKALQSLKKDSSDLYSKLLGLLQQRLGDACNETGKVMLTELRSLLTSLSASDDSGGFSSVKAAEALLSSAEFWFQKGLFAFEQCGDLRNLALLRCNLCQCYKLRANAVFAPETTATSSIGPTHAEKCLQEAATHLQSAHEAFGERDIDPITWDMVSGELAATFLVLGVRRRQSLIGSGNIPLIAQALRLSPGTERSIVDPMERARIIYEQMGNYHQAAAAHYQLALFYSKIWTCQRDEGKTREKLSAAFQNYHAAHSFFSQAMRGNETTFCLLCMDLSSLYSAVSGEECISKALVCCLETVDAFSPEVVEAILIDLKNRVDWINKMDTITASLEERVFKLLRNLVKLEDENHVETSARKYKELYRVGLTAKMKPPSTEDLPSCGELEVDEKANRILTIHYLLSTLRSKLNESHIT